MRSAVTICVLVGLVVFLGAISPPPAKAGLFQDDEADAVAKQRAVSQWRKFVGTWIVENGEGLTSETHIIESHPGVFVHRGPDFTVMVGWDDQKRAMRAFGFSTDDRPFEQIWQLVDDQPTFAGRLIGTEERFLWSIRDGVWTMDFGAFGTMTATRAP